MKQLPADYILGDMVNLDGRVCEAAQARKRDFLQHVNNGGGHFARTGQGQNTERRQQTEADLCRKHPTEANRGYESPDPNPESTPTGPGFHTDGIAFVAAQLPSTATCRVELLSPHSIAEIIKHLFFDDCAVASTFCYTGKPKEIEEHSQLASDPIEAQLVGKFPPSTMTDSTKHITCRIEGKKVMPIITRTRYAEDVIRYDVRYAFITDEIKWSHVALGATAAVTAGIVRSFLCSKRRAWSAAGERVPQIVKAVKAAIDQIQVMRRPELSNQQLTEESLLELALVGLPVLVPLSPRDWCHDGDGRMRLRCWYNQRGLPGNIWGKVSFTDRRTYSHESGGDVERGDPNIRVVCCKDVGQYQYSDNFSGSLRKWTQIHGSCHYVRRKPVDVVIKDMRYQVQPMPAPPPTREDVRSAVISQFSAATASQSTAGVRRVQDIPATVARVLPGLLPRNVQEAGLPVVTGVVRAFHPGN